ncbi:mobile element protein [Bacteroides graminisolvens DSM 19988 = JCM 15093]|uniref:Mobile element protein n=1 Tax=Bacteroides graminisolvens DSM 19988 = JCM 15093 TaxID=1121097 RepID=A0A069D3G2_9BACE|nr:mobile element protein [Bacteroides graminisolvens DSM 19988 = JCM 15093]
MTTLAAHGSKAYHLGFGKHVTRSNLAKVNERREPKIFEEFAYRMIDIARKKRINKDFEIDGQVYAFDSTTIDLCLRVFWWAKFRHTKAGIKMHTLYDVETDIPTYRHVTQAKLHDQNAMDSIPYQPGAYYIFDRGYFDLKRLFHITEIESFFVIRQRGNLQYEILEELDVNHNKNGILSDQLIELTGYNTAKKYPEKLRRVVYYAADLNRTFVYLTNNLEIPALQVALLYKYCWRVELFFKWIKQHLKIKSFWGTTESAVRIQIFTSITAYCMVAIIEHDLKSHRTTYEVLRILIASLFDKTPIKDIFANEPVCDTEDGQLTLNLF